jgi:cellulose biosynthesis protein BcsQ
MTNIAIIAKKGGVGKTTVTMLLYEAFRQAGRPVFIHDWDPQGSVTKCLKSIHQGKIPTMNGKDDNAIMLWDSPPDLTHTATATAARNANIALIVTSPAPLDMWEAQETANFVQSRNSGAVIRVVINKFKRATVLGRGIEGNTKLINVPTLPVMLNQRECYIHASVHGWQALDNAARQEVLQLGISLLSFQS